MAHKQKPNDNDATKHLHIIGRSGMGKSYLLRQMIRQDIENSTKHGRPGLVIIDPAGDLYKFCLKEFNKQKGGGN